MCGIAGIAGPDRGKIISRMTTALEHRGPDGIGYFADQYVDLATARLSLLDLKASALQRSNGTGKAIVFNGEIYNHRELRAALQRKGYAFTTSTDTEVVLRLYEDIGPQCVEHLKGMFAFAVYDGTSLFLARDRLGIKPLYYAVIPNTHTFVFASEIKAILQHPAVSARLNMRTVADWLVLGHPVATETFFSGIQSLASGHTMAVTCGAAVSVGPQRRYWSCGSARDAGLDLANAENLLEKVLQRAVESHLAADVDVGLMLSGGLDSTALALMTKDLTQKPLKTFAVSASPRDPDPVHAARVANLIGAEHLTLTVGFDDYLEAVPSFVSALEQPVSLLALPLLLLSRAARERVTCCLNGEGADELFGGYREYVDPSYRAKQIAGKRHLFNRLRVAPSPRTCAIIEAFAPNDARSPDYLERVLQVNMQEQLEHHHLDVLDKLGMATGLEIRVPYLDDDAVAQISRMPTSYLIDQDLGIQKYLLRRLCLKRFGMDVADIVLRRKQGLPAAGRMLLQRFDRLCEELLPANYVDAHPLGFCFDSKRHLLLFEYFLEMYLVHRGDVGRTGTILDFIRSRAKSSSHGATLPFRPPLPADGADSAKPGIARSVHG